MKTLETERLYLRPFTLDDVDAYYEICINPEVGPSVGWVPHKNREETKSIIEDFIAKGNVYAIAFKPSNKLIGSIGVSQEYARPLIESCKIAAVLDKNCWNNGYATEALMRLLLFCFAELGKEVVAVWHFPLDTRSRRVIEKCGFKFEGTLRHARKDNAGNVHDIYVYSMLREEYEKKIKQFLFKHLTD